MKQRSLIRKLMSQFVVCVAVLFMLATPLFYWLTENYYAEDMADLREAVAQGAPLPACDLEEDVMEGIMIQYVVTSVTLGIAVLLMLRLMAKRLWAPFDRTLERIEQFRLEDDRKLVLPMGDVREFNRLNEALDRSWPTAWPATMPKRSLQRTPRTNCRPPWPSSRPSSTCCSSSPGLPASRPTSSKTCTV